MNRVRVLDADGHVLYDRASGPDAVEPVRHDAPVNAPVLTDDGPIGKAELTVDAAVLRKGLQETLSVMGLTFLGVILVLTAATGVLLRIFIRRPLEGLREAMERVSRGDFSTPLASAPYQELEGIVQSFRSMTGEIRQREAALQDQVSERQRAEQRYQLAVVGSNDGLWDWDLATNRIYFSPRWKEMLGFAEDEFPNDIEMWKKRIHPDDRERVVSEHLNFMAGITETLDLEYRLLHRDGTWRHIHAQGASLKDRNGDPVRIAGSNADITERKRAEAALKLSEEHYRAIVDGFEGFIAICDAQHRVTFMNDRLARRAAGSPPGAPCHEIMHGLETPCPWCVAERVRAGETVRWEIQSPKDKRWYYVVNTPVYLPDGSVSMQSMVQDMTERHEAERAMRESESRYRSLIETTSEGFVMLDMALAITDTNAALCQSLGLDRDQVMGHNLLEFMDDENQEILQVQANRRADTPHRKYEFAFKRVSGGTVSGSFAFFTDITDRKRMETQLRYQAMHDPLTALANRTLCLDRISRALERARRRDDYYYALIFLDLDRFKIINDSMGHNFGDQILVEVGHRLMDCVRELDTVSRFGSDEYVVLLEELGSPRKAIQVVKRMRQMLRRPFSIENHEVQLTASIGIVLGPTDFKKPEDILQYANIAMHRAKATGRDRFKVFSTRLLEHAVHLMTLENDMDRALANGEFFLAFQPIVRLAGGRRLYGFEALARWRHPTRGLIPPDEFIPVAEETGAIMDLGMWVLHQACETMMQWRRSYAHADDLVMSVNVSGRQFGQHDLANRIRRVLRNTGLPAAQLKLEITETAIMENAAHAVDILRQLKDLGVTLSIDDFGTGYSSMSYLQRLPLDNLKIDLSFIQLLDVAPENIEIVKAIINLAHTLKLEVVAEGVERRAHVQILQDLGCDFGQGYLYARPLSQEDAERFVAEIELWKMPN